MNIAILSRAAHLYSTQSLIRAAVRRGHDISIIDVAECTPGIINNKPEILYEDDVLLDFDAIIPRIGASITLQGARIVRQFESMGVFTPVSSQALLDSRDKWTSMQILSRAGIPMPHSVLGAGRNIEAFIEHFPSERYVIKLLEGTHGEGVILTESRKGTLSLIEALLAADVKFLIQEYIEESGGADLRAIVVDGVVVASMKRQGQEGEFRSNLHRGGSSTDIRLSYEEEKVAIHAAKALRLGVCGVDILQSERGPLLLEVNSSPGLEGIEGTTGRSVSKSIVAYIERNYNR